jgi:hypothetical protein
MQAILEPMIQRLKCEFDMAGSFASSLWDSIGGHPSPSTSCWAIILRPYGTPVLTRGYTFTPPRLFRAAILIAIYLLSARFEPILAASLFFFNAEESFLFTGEMDFVMVFPSVKCFGSFTFPIELR